MSEDSSDDSEPEISSPASSNSAEDDDDGEGFFKFHARPFNRERSDSSPSPRLKQERGKRKSTSSDRQLKMQLRQKRLKIDEHMNRNARRCLGEDDEDENDDSSDDDRRRNVVISIDDDSPSHAKSQGPENNATIEVLESSDDEDNTNVSFAAMPSAMSLETTQALRKSKSAIRELRQAQQYHAEDITVATPIEPKTGSVQLTKEVTKPAVSLGKSLQITCRAVIHLNGKKQKDRETILRIRENEKLQVLLVKFLDQNNLPEYSVVIMNFDGETLNYSRTPKSYKMENHDMVDATVKSNIVSSQSVSSKVGQKISLTIRERVGKQVRENKFRLGKLQNLQDLFQMYEEETKTKRKYTFNFDGQSLHPSKTPACYDMEDDDLIDVMLR